MDRNHLYNFMPIPISWYSLSGLGYQQHFPTPVGAFFTNEQPSLGHVFDTSIPTGFSQKQNMSTGNQDNATATCDNSHNPFHVNDGGEGPRSTPSREHERTAAAAAAAADNPGAMVPSMSRRPFAAPQTDRALQFLSQQLKDAIKVWDEYIQEHNRNVETVLSYMDAACRDGLWTSLLEAKFQEDECNGHMLRSLPVDVDWATRQAQEASRAEAAAAAATVATTPDEKLDKCEKTVHEMGILRMRCNRVAELAGKALKDLGECKKLLEEMRDMEKAVDATTQARSSGRVVASDTPDDGFSQ